MSCSIRIETRVLTAAVDLGKGSTPDVIRPFGDVRARRETCEDLHVDREKRLDQGSIERKAVGEPGGEPVAPIV